LSAFAAAASGDIKPLESVLAKDAVLYSDGGGRVAAATHPIFGRERIVRFVEGVTRKGFGPASLEFRPSSINGLGGAVLLAGGRVVQTLAFDIEDGMLHAVYAVRNPDKLSRVLVH
jgi:RNA polymerase sigma-70 factor (ECF subfamily)